MAGMPPPFPLGAGPPGAPSQSGVTDVSMGNTAEKPSVAGTAADFGQWTEEEVNTINGMQGQFSNLRVRKLIDEGASSQVWEGEWAGARVVIKVLREQEALRSFLSEVRAHGCTRDRGRTRTPGRTPTPPPACCHHAARGTSAASPRDTRGTPTAPKTRSGT